MDETGVVRLFERFIVRPGHGTDLADVCGPLVAAVAREPGSLQTCIALDETGERAVVVQAFAGRQGLAAHLNNQELLELTGELQQHVDHDTIRILGALPEKFATAFRERGLPAELATPWPGVDRSEATAPEQPALEIYAELELRDADRYKAGVSALSAVAGETPGVLWHRAFGMPGPRAAVIEGYADLAAMAAWGGSPAYTKAAAGIAGTCDMAFMDVIGEPEPAARKRLGRFGAIVYQPVARSSRYDRLAPPAG